MHNSQLHRYLRTNSGAPNCLVVYNHERRFPAFCRSRCFRILPLRGLAQTKKKAGLAILVLDTGLARERKCKVKVSVKGCHNSHPNISVCIIILCEMWIQKIKQAKAKQQKKQSAPPTPQQFNMNRTRHCQHFAASYGSCTFSQKCLWDETRRSF